MRDQYQSQKKFPEYQTPLSDQLHYIWICLKETAAILIGRSGK
jgi:hypothetical protein